MLRQAVAIRADSATKTFLCRPGVFARGLSAALRLGRWDLHATLYALDGESGKQLYSSGSAVAGYSYGSGLAVANSRIYFGASDNAMYSFGFSKMEPQLTDR